MNQQNQEDQQDQNVQQNQEVVENNNEQPSESEESSSSDSDTGERMISLREKFRKLGVNLSWPRHEIWLPKVYPNQPKTETWA